jgi:hypothetical protein
MRSSVVVEFGTRYAGSAMCFTGVSAGASPRSATPMLGTFPAIIGVSELFCGIEIRPHMNAAFHPRLIRLFGNERAAVVGGYPRLGSCR